MTERAGEVRVQPAFHGTGYDVFVPVHRDGQVLAAGVCVQHDADRKVFTIEVTEELLDQATDGVTAAVQMALRAVAEVRRG